MSNNSKFLIFCLNYGNFIKDIWGSENSKYYDPRMYQHFKLKFSEYYDKHDSYGVMIRFYSELSENYREQIDEYIESKESILINKMPTLKEVFDYQNEETSVDENEYRDLLGDYNITEMGEDAINHFKISESSSLYNDIFNWAIDWVELNKK